MDENFKNKLKIYHCFRCGRRIKFKKNRFKDKYQNVYYGKSCWDKIKKEERRVKVEKLEEFECLCKRKFLGNRKLVQERGINIRCAFCFKGEK